MKSTYHPRQECGIKSPTNATYCRSSNTHCVKAEIMLPIGFLIRVVYMHLIRLTIKTFFCLALALPMLVQAHTALKTSTPENGSTIATIPSDLDLVFNADVRLIKLELMGVGHEMPTNFEPSSEVASTYKIQTPGMHPGEFTVNWAAIGADGHTVTNSFSFVVDPATASE